MLVCLLCVSCTGAGAPLELELPHPFALPSEQVERRAEDSPRAIPLKALNANARRCMIAAPKKSPWLVFAFEKSPELYAFTESPYYALELEFEQDEMEADRTASKNTSHTPHEGIPLQRTRLPAHDAAASPLQYSAEFDSATSFDVGLLSAHDVSPSGALKKDMTLRYPITAQRAPQQRFTVSIGFAGTNIQPATPYGCAVYSQQQPKLIRAAIVPVKYGWLKIPQAFWYGASAGSGSIPPELCTESLVPHHTELPRLRTSARLTTGNKEDTTASAAQHTASTDTGVSATSTAADTAAHSMRARIVIHFDPSAAIDLSAQKRQPRLSFTCGDQQLSVYRAPNVSQLTMDSCLFSGNTTSDTIPIAQQDTASSWSGVTTEYYPLSLMKPITADTSTRISDSAMSHFHGFNAHDYRAETLALFFQEAEQEHFPLNKSELYLRTILFHNGIITRTEAGIEAGHGAIVSISRLTQALRYRLLTHECLYGIYFTEKSFREAVAKAFQQTDPRARLFQRYFELYPSLQYNTDDAYLFQNEFMAYLLQQNSGQLRPYYVDRISWFRVMNTTEPELCAYISQTKAEAFIQAAAQMSSFLYIRWSLKDGRIPLASLRPLESAAPVHNRYIQ